jgi:hypothetical protein
VDILDVRIDPPPAGGDVAARGLQRARRREAPAQPGGDGVHEDLLDR